MAEWTTYDTVEKLPEGLWNRFVACGQAALDERLLRVSEEVYSAYRFRYYLSGSAEEPAALFMTMTGTGNPFLADPSASNVWAVTGTPETTGAHFRFDPEKMPEAVFFREAYRAVRECENEADELMIRDFIGDTGRAATVLIPQGFQSRSVLPVCEAVIPEDVETLEEYIGTLKSKHRYQIGRYRMALPPDAYAFEQITDYLPLLDRLYPLYVEVSGRAAEYTAGAHSPDYFIRIKERFGDDSVVVAVRELSSGEILGFMLILYSEKSCVQQYIGFRKIPELFLWHNLTISSVGNAIARKIRRINMGVTHEVAKRKFGAVTHPVTVFSKRLRS